MNFEMKVRRLKLYLDNFILKLLTAKLWGITLKKQKGDILNE